MIAEGLQLLPTPRLSFGGDLKKFDIMRDGLNNFVDALGDKKRIGEVLLAIEAERVSEGDGAIRMHRWFVLWGDSIGKPKCQTFIRCEPWDIQGQHSRDLSASPQLDFPIIVRICDRASVLCKASTVLDALTNDTLINETCGMSGPTRVFELEYTLVSEDARLSIATGSRPKRLLWQAGLRAALPREAPRPKTGLEGIPTEEPEVAAARRQLRRPRPQAGGRARGGVARGAGGQHYRGASDRAGRGRRGHDRLAIADGDDEAHALEDVAAAEVQAPNDEALASEFVDHLVGHLQDEAVPEADGTLAEVIAEMPGVFAEMYVASMEAGIGEVDMSADAAEASDLLDQVAKGNSSSSSAEALMKEMGAEGEECNDMMASSVEGLGPSSSGHGGPASSTDPPQSPAAPVAQQGPLAAAAPSGAEGAAHMFAPGAPPPHEAAAPPPPPVIEWDPIGEGGLVRRDGRPVGKVTAWPNGKNLGVKCMLHSGCTHVVTSKVQMEECARWLAAGREPPKVCSREMAKELKDEHKAVRKPMPPPKPKASK